MTELNTRERSFVTHYLGKAGGNATKAAICAGYSKRTAGSKGSQLLKKVNVQAELQARIRASEQREKADAEERDRILSAFARDVAADKDVRISAIKELNKVDGRHTVRHQIEGRVTLEQALTASRS